MPMKIVAIARDQWHDQWMGRQHLAWALREFCPMLFVQEPNAWHSEFSCRDESFFRSQTSCEADSLTILRLPKALSRRANEGLWNRFAFHQKSRMISRQLCERDRPLVAYIWNFALWRYAKLLKPDLTVYHVFDVYRELYEPAFRHSKAQVLHRRACAEADVVITLNEQQAACMPRTDVEVFGSAVATGWYNEPWVEPADLAAIPHPRIGWVGSLNLKVDFAWFKALAEVGGWNIVLVGKPGNLSSAQSAEFEALRQRGNVHYLGQKAGRDVPAYIRGLDVGLMNYALGSFADRASPLKLYEYCAAGLPIVASKLPSLVELAEAQPLIRYADSPEGAVETVRGVLAAGRDEAEIASRRAFAEANSWRVRAQGIHRLICDRLVARGFECGERSPGGARLTEFEQVR